MNAAAAALQEQEAMGMMLSKHHKKTAREYRQTLLDLARGVPEAEILTRLTPARLAEAKRLKVEWDADVVAGKREPLFTAGDVPQMPGAGAFPKADVSAPRKTAKG